MYLFKPDIKKLEKRRNVKSLIKALKYNDWLVKQEAADALGKIRDKRAVEPLIEALSDNTKYIHFNVQRALGKIGDKRAVEPLLKELKEGKNILGVIEALGDLGDHRAVSPIIHILRKSRDKSSRKTAVLALGNYYSNNKIVEPLIDVLKYDMYGEVREASAIILKWTEDLRAIEPLLDNYKEKEAIYILERINNEEDFKPLLAILGRKYSNYAVEKKIKETLLRITKYDNKLFILFLQSALEEKDIDVRSGAIICICELRDRQLISQLIQALNEKNADIRAKAANALGFIGGERAVRYLIQALKDENINVRVTVLEALGSNLDVKDAAIILKEACKDEDYRIRSAAIDGFIKSRHKEKIIPIINALDDKNADIRAKAANALGNTRDERSVEPLMKSLRKSKSYECIVALGKIGNKKTSGAVIEYLIPKKPRKNLYDAKDFENLFEDYTNYIVYAINYIEKREIFGITDPCTHYYYKLDLTSVEKLCAIATPISTNILIRLSRIEDFDNLIYAEYAMGNQYGILSCEPIRKLAKIEIQKRGNPKYNEAVFLEENAWKL